MKSIEAPCPSCGSPVEFRVSASLVTICPSCSSVVARGDRKLEDHGRVAAIVATDSVLRLGKTGRYRDHPFEIVGHVQYRHPAGGIWDEWYAAFPGDRWCWIAEAQGKRFLTQERKINSHMRIPTWSELSVGAPVQLRDHLMFTVNEFNTAALLAAEGEIPFDARPGCEHRFADLSGPDNRFGTLVYEGDEVTLYRGREVSLSELGIDDAEDRDRESVAISGTGVSCPQCGGALELRAPDAAQRVTCPYCSSLLDIEQGNLKFLKTLSSEIKPIIPIGSEGVLSGVKYVVIGFVRRSVYFDKQYTWDEFLLYEAATGFRWLVHSDRHWSFVEPIPTDEITPGNILKWKGTRFRIFQRAWARVVYVLGEFYWKVSLGETVLAEDFIAPPRMITLEYTPEAEAQVSYSGSDDWQKTRFVERIASLGTYLAHEQVEAAFKLGRLPRGFGVAPNQPAPTYGPVYLLWLAWLAIFIAIDLVISLIVKHPVGHEWTVIAIACLSFFPGALWLHARSFEQSRWADSEFAE
ncbi:MAG: DUF4178 domain-containing protein [Planctomycetes bacterium]|nr:DUF4178 domain-containing protein [Planctomycetota bacterium]